MLTYNDVRGYLLTGLEGKGYTESLPVTAGQQSMPLIDPGPFSLPTLLSRTPGPIVFATVGNGAGLTNEQLYDQVFITIRSAGKQGDFDNAERLALDIDRLLLAIHTNTLLGQTLVRYITRTGGAPQLVDLDPSDRYHFQCTYITEAATGL